jgi:O-antigen/teichoic acid export membrane protein
MSILITLKTKIPRHLLITIYSWAGRLISIICSLFSLKLTTKLLGIDNYSIYIILSNIVAWTVLCDFGLGYSLQNYITELKSKGVDYKRYIFITVFLLFSILIVCSILIWILTPLLSELIFGKILVGNTVLIESTFFITCLIGLFTCLGSISTKIFYGLQNGHIPNLLLSLGSVLNIFGLYFIYFFKLVNLTNVILITFGINALISIIPLIYFFYNSKPKFLNFDKVVIIQILKRGIGFGGFAIMSAGVLQVDYLIMSQFIRPSDIVAYSLLFKLFSLVFIVYNTLLSTLWPMFSEWSVNKKVDLIRTNIKKNILFGILIFTIFTLIIIFLGDEILGLITNIKISLPINLICLIGFYFMIRVWTDMFAIVLQSVNYLRPLWIFTPIQALISISLQVYFSLKFGVIGIVIALILSFLITVSWALPFFAYKKIK